MTKLPQAPDAEKALLCCMMLAPDRVIGAFIENGGREDYFYKHDHLVIYRQLEKMWKAKQHIDHITVTQALEDAGALEKVGGAGYIADVYICLPVAAGAQDYARTLREKWQFREVIRLTESLRDSAYRCDKNTLEDAQAGLIQIAGMSESQAKTMEMPELIKGYLDRAEEQKASGGKLPGLETGIPELDMAIRGMKPGQMITIGADTGYGKSAFSAQIAKHNAAKGIPVAVFSLEMDAHEITGRLISNHSGVDLSKVEWGYVSADESERLIGASGELSRAPLIIRDEAFLSPLQFQASSRKLRAERKVELIIIDYLQLMDLGGSDDSRQVAVARGSRTIKLTAKELGIPIIVLSQLTGENTRESKAIMQDSDLFMIIHPDTTGDPSDMIINIKKGRGCGKARIPIKFLGPCVRFEAR